tara:strand:+ start:6395 stop:7093 length:699 start_codon:yes stop_codon:yes gene_type:complete
MEYNNYSISRKKGQFYLKSKTPQEGYEEITYGEGKKTYHKYKGTIQGTPKYFGTKEVEFEGRKLNFLELSLVEGEVTNKISVNLKNKGGYTDEVKIILSALDGYTVGEPVTMTPKISTSQGKNGKSYENLNLYMNYQDIKNDQGKGQSTGFISYDDIPGPVKGDDGMGGVTWDWTPSNKFYYNKLKEIEARFGGETSTESQPAPVSEEPTKTSTAKPATPTSGVSDNDDLPF